MIQQEPDWFVRLDSSQDTGGSSAHYEHPASWTDEELSAVLSRLLLEERVGLLDNARTPRSVFSLEEIALLVPAVRNAFQKATPSEWIAFTVFEPRGTEIAATSGGMFLVHSKLHVIVANHRTVIAKDSEELARVVANPFYSIRGSGGALVFDAQRFVVGTQPNWSGGHRASASELILDHRGFLSYLKQGHNPAAPVQASASSNPGFSTESGASQSRSFEREDVELKRSMARLQEEIEQLKKRVSEQAEEINRLKRASDRSPQSTPGR